MPPTPKNPYGQTRRAGAYSRNPIAARTSYSHVSMPTDVRSSADGAEPSGTPPIVSDERENPACVRKPYRLRQYVTAAVYSVSGSTRRSRASTCSRTPDTEDSDPSSTRLLQRVGVSRPADALKSTRGGRSSGSAQGCDQS